MQTAMKHVSLAEFQHALHTKFGVQLPEGRAEFMLAEIEVQDAPRGQERFSLILKGSESRFLPQGTYMLEHEQLGELPLFMVPIGKEQDTILYQIVFHRFVEEEKP